MQTRRTFATTLLGLMVAPLIVRAIPTRLV